MRATSFVIGFLAILATVSLGFAAPSLEIRFPEDKVYVTQQTIRVIGTVSDASVQKVNIRVSGGELVGAEAVSVVKGAFEAAVKLKAGSNEISVSPANKGEGDKIKLFLRTGANAKEVPGDFKRYFLHAPTGQKTSCQDCHHLDSTPVDYRRMNVMGLTCQNGTCHQNLGNEKYVHGPVGGGTCIACHNPHGSLNQHAVSREPLPLCLVCHEAKEEELEQAHVHQIISASGCTDCHNPHESPYRFQLSAGTTSESCYVCHDDSKAKMEHVHGPVASDDCNACHNPHASPNKFMMPEPGNDLCFLCHETIHEEMDRKNIHKPVEEACVKCHDPHGAPNKKLLLKAEDMLCFGCHEGIQQEIQAATVHHKPVADKNCMGCHTPHGSDYIQLLASSAQQICFDCHTELGKVVSESEQRHGPVEENDCSSCHTPHGSANPKILNQFFPVEFYNTYTPERYALCFECHNEDIALDEHTTTLTGFRNGDLNLHHLHIHKVRRGRSCKACHEVHASNQARHIRTEVPYGKMWSYPIMFTELEQGGNCIVGCHKPKEYSRVKPVVYK